MMGATPRDLYRRGTEQIGRPQLDFTAMGGAPDLRTTAEIQKDDDLEEPKKDHLGRPYYQ